MKNPNSPIAKIRQALKKRWSGEDYPGGESRFQVVLFAKDLATFVVLPIISILLFKACETASSAERPARVVRKNSSESGKYESAKSQIIFFKKSGEVFGAVGARRSPGTLIRVRLLNRVDTSSTAPVHVQIVDNALGTTLLGGTLVGDAIPDKSFEKVAISFRAARYPNSPSRAASISARALALDGTFGIIAQKREGFVTRSTLNAAGDANQKAQTQLDSLDLKQILFKALATGLTQEFSAGNEVEKNRASVLMLQPPLEFFAELTDFFPGANK